MENEESRPMRPSRMLLLAAKFIFSLTILLPIAAHAGVVSMSATTPFPSAVTAGSSTAAVYTITNHTTAETFVMIDQSDFPAGSGLAITANTCGSLAPSSTCTVTVTLTAKTTAGSSVGTLKLWAKPSATGVQSDIKVTINLPTVTPSNGTNGTISPNTVESVAYDGTSSTYTATADSGYCITGWTITGTNTPTCPVPSPAVPSTGTCTLANVTTDSTITPTYTACHTITPNDGTNGTISPNTPEVILSPPGTSTTYTVTADTGYCITGWTITGTNTPTCPVPALAQPSVGTCSLASVTSDSSITPTYTACYTVTPTAGANGTISPSTPEVVLTGNPSSLYIAMPSSGYTTDEWTVNAANVQTGMLTYQIPSVTVDSALNVTFKQVLGVSIAVGQALTGPVGTVYYKALPTDSFTAATFTTTPPTGSNFRSGSCVGSGSSAVCVAAGVDVLTTSPTDLPVLFDSTDGGVTWHQETVSGLPSNAGYRATACTGSGASAICIAAGDDDNNGSNPFVAVTTDGANNWSKATISPVATTGYYYAASCTGSTTTARCAVAGQNIGITEADIAYTDDGGSTWTTASISGNPSDGLLNTISCTGTGSTSICAAGGQDLTNSQPLLVQTTDGTSTWAVKFIAGAPAAGVIYGSSCIGADSTARCVIVGQNTALTTPLIAMTQDGGTTWTAISTVDGAALPTITLLDSVSCAGDDMATATCIAAGRDTSGSMNPYVVLSIDGGNTWTNISSNFGAASGVDAASASCTGNLLSTVCTVALKESGTGTVLFTSLDQGSNWAAQAPTLVNFDSTSSTGGI